MLDTHILYPLISISTMDILNFTQNQQDFLIFGSLAGRKIPGCCFPQTTQKIDINAWYRYSSFKISLPPLHKGRAFVLWIPGSRFDLHLLQTYKLTYILRSKVLRKLWNSNIFKILMFINMRKWLLKNSWQMSHKCSFIYWIST